MKAGTASRSLLALRFQDRPRGSVETLVLRWGAAAATGRTGRLFAIGGADALPPDDQRRLLQLLGAQPPPAGPGVEPRPRLGRVCFILSENLLKTTSEGKH